MKNLKLIISFVFSLALLIVSLGFNVFQYNKAKRQETLLFEKNEEIKKLNNNKQDNLPKHPIEIKVEECIEKTTFGKLEISKCMTAFEPEWEKEISKHLSEAKKFLSNEEYALLIKSQRAWEDYRKIQKDLIYSTIYNKYLIFYSNITIADDAAIEIVKQREKFLSSLIWCIKH